MAKLEILILIITIFISVTLLSLFLDKVFKTKLEKKENKPDVTTTVEDKKELVVEKVEEKKEKKQEKVPQVSLALQDELNEFRDYLKARITPEMVTKEAKFNHPYDIPKVNRFDNFYNEDFSDMPDFPFRKELKNKTTYEELPDDVKILLFTNFFDTKF